MKKFIGLLLFAAAFAYIEAAVVVYLRLLFYPGKITGPLFPLNLQPSLAGYVELGRELATLILLFSLSYLVATSKEEFFAFFTFSFGSWDVLYYFWLKVLINWPQSMGTWDVLFLLPVVWSSPWWCPVTVSLVMMSVAVILLKEKRKLTKPGLSLYGVGAILIFISFVWNAETIMKGNVPVKFPYALLAAGELLMLASLSAFKKSG